MSWRPFAVRRAHPRTIGNAAAARVALSAGVDTGDRAPPGT
jgi:hypothetical protein